MYRSLLDEGRKGVPEQVWYIRDDKHSILGELRRGRRAGMWVEELEKRVGRRRGGQPGAERKKGPSCLKRTLSYKRWGLDRGLDRGWIEKWHIQAPMFQTSQWLSHRGRFEG